MREILEKSARQRRNDFIRSEIERMKEEIASYRREIEITKQLCAIFKQELIDACERYGVPVPDLGEDPEDLSEYMKKLKR